MGVFTTGGKGSFANVGFTTGLILPYLERFLVGLYFSLRVLMSYYACGCFITRADILLLVRLFYYACGYFITRADMFSRKPEAYASGGYRDDLMLFKKIVLKLKTLIRMYEVGQIHVIKRKLNEYLTN